MKQLKIEFLYEHPVYKGYACDEQGNVYSLDYNHTGKIKSLKPKDNGRGYLQLHLCKDYNANMYYVHRFVWECIKGEIEEGYDVDHLDFNRHRNSIDNLLARPASENRTRISEKGKMKQSDIHRKSVIQLSLDGNFVAEYSSTIEAGKQLGINHRNIASCCRGERKSAGGSIFKYKEVV